MLAALADLVCPLWCAGCAAQGTALCAGCAQSLAGPAACCAPRPAPAGLPTVAAIARYDGTVR
ncbi:MAG: ComF family protein, partial [Frankia sp.]|nr:ComF family protein [Frankia sp.]